MNGAELLVHMLLAHEVKQVFGVPGDTNVPLYAALDKHRSSITHIMARDERSAGYMADAYSRVSNRPAIVEVPSGAGAMYALPAVAEAHESALPMILITSDTPLSAEGRGMITELDCVRLFDAITKASLKVTSAAKIPEIMRRAFRIATTGKPGAVHLAFPEDVLHEHVDEARLQLHADAGCKTFPAFPARGARPELTKLQQLICRAQRPLLIAGGGVNRAMGGKALTEFAERYRLPVVTTITGQDSILDTHELSIGIVGDNGFHPHANRAMEEADLLVYLGCRNGSVVSIGWSFPPPREGRQAAQVDIDPTVLGNNAENVLSIHSDARLALEDLNALPMPKTMATDPNWVATLNEWRRTFWKFADAQLKASPTDPLAPPRIIDALNRRLEGKPYLLFSDPGTPTPYTGRYLRLSNPDSRLFIPRAYGGLGYAIPAVVGSWYARPDIRPIGLFGDGSLGMCVGELETLVRLNVPAILMNFNNSCFGWIKALQRLHGPRQFMSVDFNTLDCAALARAFGMKAIHVEGDTELEKALDEAFAYSGPVFLDIVVESIADEIPPVFNWLKKTGVDPLLVNGKRLEIQPQRTRENA